MQEQAKQLPDVEFVSWDVILTFEDYKHKIQELQGKVDAIAPLGIFTFKDAYGHNVPYPEVLQWTVENSTLPDFSFWESRIGPGTLCTVTVSGYEQGFAAGKVARGILVEGRSPASYAMAPTVKGEPVVSLARAAFRYPYQNQHSFDSAGDRKIRLGLTFPLYCFDQILCWFPRNTL